MPTFMSGPGPETMRKLREREREIERRYIAKGCDPFKARQLAWRRVRRVRRRRP